MVEVTMHLGSLFDGSGGFPLAGIINGIVPIWRSEVEPYPIAVTRSRFPQMEHLGDVSKVSGRNIRPVDVITFGSPCQDLSVAGKRAGLKHEENGDEETTRSGLFMESIRIIKEMREVTDGIYPTFAVWENVPGAYSSNSGDDFRIVLEELAKIKGGAEISVPKPDKWSYAGCIEGDRFSIAWRTVDAQYWGVPQRRRRIFLVADFRGHSAAKILFKQEGLRGYFAQGGKPWQTVATDTERGAGADGGQGGVAYGFPLGFRPENVRCYENIRTTLCNGTRAGFTTGVICATGADIYNLKETGDVAVALTTQFNATGSGPTVIQNCIVADLYNLQLTGDKAKTLRTGQDADKTPVVIAVENHPNDSRVKLDETGKIQTLTGRMGTGGGNVPMVMAIDQGGGKSSVSVMEDLAPTLTRTHDGAPAVAYGCGNGQTNQGVAEEKAGTLNCMHEQQMVLIKQTDYTVRRLTPTECARLQGFPDRWGHPDKKDDFTDEEYQFWLDVRNTHAAINEKTQKQYTKDQMVKWHNKLHSDASEYKMWGNGIALPNRIFVLAGIAEQLKEYKSGKQNG